MLFNRPPLFELALAGALRLGGESMGTLRALTGSLGVLSVALLYGVVRRVRRGEGWLALLAALALAVYPQAIVYSRFGFSYNLLTPLVLLTLLGLWEYLRAENDTARRRWLILAALSAGTGLASDVWMLTLFPAVLLVAALRRWRDALIGGVVLALPFGLYALYMLLTVPDAFLYDLRSTLGAMGAPLEEQLPNLAVNFATLVMQDGWMLGGVAGLFLLRPARLRRLALLCFFTPIIATGRVVALHSLSFYYLIPLLPFVALGLGALVETGAPHITRTVREGLAVLPARWQGASRWLSARSLRALAALAALAIFAAPVVVSALIALDNVQDGFHTGIDPFLVSGAEARQAAGYVNAQAESGDVTIASPTVGWLITNNVADFQMAVAAEGETTPHLPSDIPPDRFASDPRFEHAHFVIVDDLWRHWAGLHVPGVYEMMLELQDWPLVYRAGSVEVYENPARTLP